MTDSREKPRELLKTQLQKRSIPARHQPNVEKHQQAHLLVLPALLLIGDSNDKPTRAKAVTVFDSSNAPQPFLDTALLDRIKAREEKG